MSNRFDLYCVPCKQGAGFRWNHGAKELTEAWRHRDTFAKLAEASRVMDFEFQFLCETSGDLAFFAAHRDHDVRARSEYGAFFGDCTGFWTCGTCDAQHNCGKPAGHDRSCGKKPS